MSTDRHQVEGDAVAAFDLGSNTIKMTVGRRAGDTDVEEFLWRSETIRLGRDLDKSGVLAQDRIDAALEALSRFAQEARDAGAARSVGVATEATRVARNGAEFLERVKEKTGIEFRVISGAEEAKLTFRGLDGVVDLDGRVAVADIGGGSTELILAADRSVLWSRSFPLGSGKLTDRHVQSDPPRSIELDQCREDAAETVAEAPLDDVTGGRLVVVGGTGEYLDRLLPPDSPRTKDTLDAVLQRVQDITSADLANLVDIPVARARVLPAGLSIAAAIADVMNPSSFTSAPSGIRRGLLLAAFAGET